MREQLRCRCASVPAECSLPTIVGLGLILLSAGPHLLEQLEAAGVEDMDGHLHRKGGCQGGRATGGSGSLYRAELIVTEDANVFTFPQNARQDR